MELGARAHTFFGPASAVPHWLDESPGGDRKTIKKKEKRREEKRGIDDDVPGEIREVEPDMDVYATCSRISYRTVTKVTLPTFSIPW